MNQKDIQAHFENKYDVIADWVSSHQLYLEYVPLMMDDGDEMPDYMYDEIVGEILRNDGFGYGFAEDAQDRYNYGVRISFVDDVPR